jgi:hypothetical protein
VQRQEEELLALQAEAQEDGGEEEEEVDADEEADLQQMCLQLCQAHGQGHVCEVLSTLRWVVCVYTRGVCFHLQGVSSSYVGVFNLNFTEAQSPKGYGRKSEQKTEVKTRKSGVGNKADQRSYCCRIS